ncbi:leucine-rich repeat domain-containing protein [Dyadobacter sp. CY312]|uniref:leucine-rich repeat domain-containing protein n=1 Tax=Dyadobacter sp. CY312 TaxID=2907303 RepID=UPI001F3F5CA8|nr:leucine-rich repeat domain-containing protein [Dyadobacter sp. CY312]MCE7039779.1 leucine-rich repeat domain-containing protein [Dyadobacter sp. CY312]
MRIFIIFTLSLLSISLAAQPVVVSKADVAKKGIVEKELDKTYGSIPEVGNEIPLSMSTRFNAAYNSVLGSDIRVKTYILTQVYFNDKGKVDYCIYKVDETMRMVMNQTGKPAPPKQNLDSLSKVIDSGLPAKLADYVSRRHVGRKGQLSVYTVLEVSKPDPKEVARQDSLMKKFMAENKGSEHKVVVRDSVIKSLEGALAIKDSLKVKELIIEKAMLEAVPGVIYRFPNLEMLSLSDNDIEQVDIDLSRLPKLNHLKLTGNILRNDGLKLTSNKTLKLLNLQSNQLTDIPDAVRNCKKLETLWLGRNSITGLTNRSFRKLKQVKDINFYKSQIAALPAGIKKMKGLQVLDLYYNNLTVLPNSISKLKRLTHLAVAHNELTDLPAKIGKMKNMNTLFAHHNRLSKLPGSIVKMKNLQVVDLGYNWFTNFPQQLTALDNLQELDLSANNFTEFPTQILAIKQLDKLHLRGNPFLTEDRETRYDKQFSLLKSKNIEVFY